MGRGYELRAHEFSYTISGAPLVAAGKVYIGNSSSEFGGATTAGHRGYLSAYDAETGALAWRFFTVPGNPAEPFEHPELERAAETWNGEWWKMGGGGTVWNSIVYDPELHTVYIGAGNGAPWPRAIRSPGGGDNLFLSSIVAVDPDTGRMKWYYQTTPGDNWDFAATQHMVLDELEIGGERRKVLMQAPKNGFFYVLDRENGELLNAFPFAALNWATHVDLETGRPVEDPAAYYEDKPQWILPGNSGAHTWHPMSWDPARRLVFIPTQELALFYALPREFSETGVYKARFNTWNLGIERGQRHADLVAASDDPEGPPRQGFLKAFDPVTGEMRWSVRNTVPYSGGLLSTATGLVFQGDGAGVLSAYDSDTGERLWSLDAYGSIGAPPVTYEIDGEQYIAVLVGAHGSYESTGRVVTLRLGGAPAFPEPPARDRSLPRPPPLEASPEQVAEGSVHYHMYCGACHGGQARSGLIADLRRMTPETHDAFLAIVLGGGLPGPRHGELRRRPGRDRRAAHPRLRHRAGKRGLGGAGGRNGAVATRPGECEGLAPRQQGQREGLAPRKREQREGPASRSSSTSQPVLARERHHHPAQPPGTELSLKIGSQGRPPRAQVRQERCATEYGNPSFGSLELRRMANILCRKVSFGYDGTERNVFTDLDLVIDTGWRTALTGRNGRGKTTLLRLIQGELAPDRGSIERSMDVRRFPVTVTDPDLRAFDAAKDAAGPFRHWSGRWHGCSMPAMTPPSRTTERCRPGSRRRAATRSTPTSNASWPPSASTPRYGRVASTA